MPVQGILTSPAAFSQAEFDQLKQQVQQGTVARTQALHAQTAAAKQWFAPPKTEAGPGGGPVWMNTPQSTNQLIQALEADGYAGVKLGDAWPAFTYQGHMLNGSFHVLDPVFGGLKVDYRL